MTRLSRSRRLHRGNCLARAIAASFFAAAALGGDPITVPAAASSVINNDVPVTPAGSALRRFGLYEPFDGTEEAAGGSDADADARCSPRHIHLSLGDDETSADEKSSAAMTVSFSVPSKDAACRPEKLRASVVYAPKPSPGVEQSGDERRRYARPKDVRWYNATSDRTGAHYESDWLYHVQLKGLKRDEEYRYRIEIENAGVTSRQEDVKVGWMSKIASLADDWIAATSRRRLASAVGDRRGGAPILASATLSFRTAPSPGYRAPTKIALLGDLGQTYNSTQTMLNLVRETELDPSEGQTPASLLFCAGDMSYADTDQARWDNWFALIEPLISRTALQVTAGNHEIECDAKTHETFAAYENRFRMPNPTGPAEIEPIPADEIDPLWGCGTPSIFRGAYDGGNSYYAFTYGMVRFLALSPYSDTSLGSRQYRWIEDELRAVDRTVTPWVVVVHHVQFYTTFLAHNDEAQTTVMRQAVEPLFVKYGVNLVVSGHDHAYMRSRPMKYGASDPTRKSPVYIIVGEGGNREHHVKDYLHPEPEEWVDRRDRTEYGFGTLEAVNSTWARWRWVRDGSSADADGGVTEDVWLRNQHFL